MSESLMMTYLPCKDIDKTVEFLAKLGFKGVKQDVAADAVVMALSPLAGITVMARSRFERLTGRSSDNSTHSDVVVGLTVDTRYAVDRFCDRAISYGAADVAGTQDYGTMYARSFKDLDNHTWRISWLSASLLRNASHALAKTKSDAPASE